MKRTLLVDTNRAAYPIYQALRALGHEVWIVGGKPQETLAKLAPNYEKLDYSNTGRLASFVEEKGFDYLVPGCTDLSYQACAEINEGRFPGIDTPEATRAINNKEEFRERAAELGLPVPQVLSLDDSADVETAIVKPADSFSGRGITVLHDTTPTKLASAFESACRESKTGKAIIEEYVTGQLFSHSAFFANGQVIADFVVQEDCTTNPFTVDTSRVAINFPNRMLDSLRQDAIRLVSSLRLQDGLIHTQFIAQDGRYWIIEVTRRCPGDIYSLLIEFSTGYPYAASYAAPFVGENAASIKERAVGDRIIRHTVTSKNGASLWGFRFARPVDIRLFVPLSTSGDFIDASPYGRAGIFFFGASSKAEQDTLYQELLTERLYRFD